MTQPPRFQELDQLPLDNLVDMLGRDDAAMLVETLLLDIQQQREAFLTAMESGALDIIGRCAHSLKSGVTYVGAQRLSDLCRTVEDAAKAADWPSLKGQSDTFNTRLLSIEAELRTVLSALRS